MPLKIQREDRCPVCGRENVAERIKRGRFVRWIRPNAKLMKCRLCLTRYLVRKLPETQIR